MKRLLWVLVVIALLTSLGISAQRWGIEVANRQVEIVYDLRSLLELRDTQGLDLETLLSDLKSFGVETIAIEPTNVGEMMFAGILLPEEVLRELPEKSIDLGKYFDFPVKFEAEQFELVQAAGLKIAPKINKTPWDLEHIWLDYEPELLILSGQGTIDLVDFANSDATIALVEFSTPKIEPTDPSTMVRLHGISAPEMLVLSEERILNRYMRAVKERNLRVLYVRPFVEGENSWDRSLALLSSLQTRLEASGFRLGQAQPFALWQTPWILALLVATGIWAATVLYGLELFPQRRVLLFYLGIVALFAGIALLLIKPVLAKQGFALLAAIIFPSFAVRFKWGNTPRRRYLGAILFSLSGALLVVAMLTGTEFLIKVQEFRGVKLMHIAPIALVCFSLLRPLKDWLKRDIPVPYLLALGFVGLAGALYILRTGNFGLPVLNLEVRAREFLENLLIVRPRTKELFLGYPALYFAVRAKNPRKSWWLPLAVISQLSLVNTFTHTHTFLWISLLRVLYGALFGYLLGWLLFKIFTWGKGRLQHDLDFRLLRVRQSR